MKLELPLRSREISELSHSLVVGGTTFCQIEIVILSKDIGNNTEKVIKVLRTINDETLDKTSTTYYNNEEVGTKTTDIASETRKFELDAIWEENWKPKTEFLGDKFK